MQKPFAITLDVGSSLENRTGSWRTLRPVYVHKLPPCNNQCPAGEDIQGWLYYAESGRYEEAWRHLVKRNPLPACMGRVCYHTCEGACNRGCLDESVGINSVERFLGDHAIENGYAFVKPQKKRDKKVLIVGSGPAGLSAAYQLALKGWNVTIKEGAPQAGGMMRYGIPKYRLPRTILDKEIQRILDLGVTLELNTCVKDLQEEMKAGGYDAAFLAVGASLANRAYIPGGDAKHMLDAVSVLRSMEGEAEPLLGRKVVVYGGGNTAIDVARSAKRLGAEPLIIYRRTREKMPAHDFEVEEALEEGVSVKWLSTISETDGQEVKIEKMKLDENGHPQPTGEFETVQADAVVLALGQSVDLGLLDKVSGLNIKNGVVQVDTNMYTGVPGIYAGGDMVPGDRNVTVAIGHGYKAARAIDAYLKGEELVIPLKKEIASYENLNTWYYADAPKTVRPQLDLVRRQSTFDEVQHGLTEENALFEARRCLSCGNCLQCDNCYGVCPDNAVIKTGEEKVPYVFNYDYCKGCGICSSECPCGAIRMEPEDI
ncbi:MAG: NAD(P)-binding protein [Burkholderiaceae bacterium]|nr:NAD(P)-binding protein [Burkholderiaceae bacterium]